ncbi:MAG: flagellar hook-basal body protein [Lachnospiraceae bacterium]|nr:flagellar hook-basal body protein [Lachnospiraceae bacterium]
MLRSLYTAWTGMFNEQQRLDVISNNMANSATVGFKKEGASSQSFDKLLTIKIRDKSENWQKREIGEMRLGVKVGETYTDYSQGSLRETGNTYDLALEGDGFFVVNYTRTSGEQFQVITRTGTFHKTPDGYIVDADGNHLQGENGDVQVSTDSHEVVIDTDGTIYEDGEATDRILIRDYEDYDYLKKFGDTYYLPIDGSTEKDAEGIIRQGYTEQSNVQVVNEMVNLIAITRAYEAGQKVIRSVDSTIELAVSSLGKV